MKKTLKLMVFTIFVLSISLLTLNSCNFDISDLTYLEFDYLENSDSYAIKSNPRIYMPDKISLPGYYNDKPVTHISDNAFAHQNVTWVKIPDSVTSIGECAFYGCTNLTNIVMPDSVVSIGDGAFSGCYSLTNITIPNSVASIGDYAFFNCSSFTSVVISDSVTTINEYTFSGCSNLTSIVLGKNVDSIDQYAFDGCYSLTSVVIGDSVTFIGDHAFYNCDSLTEVYYNGTSADWAKINISYSNDPLTNATRYYYSETEPTTEGNFWHWGENGEVVIWE